MTDQVQSPGPEADTAEAERLAEDASWEEANAEALDANDDFKAKREEAAEDREEQADNLYLPPSERGAARQQADRQQQEAEARANAEQAAQQQIAQMQQAQAARMQQISEVLPDAAADYRGKLADFGSRVQQLAHVENPSARAAMQATLQREAEGLGAEAQRLAAGAHQTALAKERERLVRLRPSLANPMARENLVAWAERKYGLTRQQIEGITDTGTILRGYDAYLAEQQAAAEKREAEESKNAEAVAETRRKAAFDSLPVEAKAAAYRGEINPQIALYGTTAQKEAAKAEAKRNQRNR